MSNHSLAELRARTTGANGAAMTWLLKLESALALAGAVLGYWALGGHWPMFALLFLAPDLTMAGYLRNPRIGAVLYNAGHTYLSPAALALAGLATGTPALFLIALIWAAHIGFDRILGYGLKLPTRFTDTHLGPLGKGADPGVVSRPSNSPHSNGLTGSTTGGSSSPSAIVRPPRLKRAIMRN